jgi:hypothetical protein
MRLFVLMVAAFFSSCQSEMNKPDLNQFVMNEENGLTQENLHDLVDIEVTYRPRDLVIEQMLDKEYSQQQFDSIGHLLDSVDYFVIRFTKNGEDVVNSYAGDETSFSAITNYLSYEISKDIRLIVGEKAIPVDDFVYQQGFGVAKASSLLVAFKSAMFTRDSDFSVVIEDSRFNTGVNEFKFQAEDITSIPRLKRRQ